jgi:hypothetical protein
MNYLVDRTPTLLDQENNSGPLVLPSGNDNDCPSTSTDPNISTHTMSTILSFPLQLSSNNSVNKMIEILNSSSIQLGSINSYRKYKDICFFELIILCLKNYNLILFHFR